MGCGCGGSSKRQFEYIAKDGTVTVVNTQTEAIRLARENGGSWQIKK